MLFFQPHPLRATSSMLRLHLHDECMAKERPSDCRHVVHCLCMTQGIRCSHLVLHTSIVAASHVIECFRGAPEGGSPCVQSNVLPLVEVMVP